MTAMTYMEMLPIVAELSTTWNWLDSAGRTAAEKATAMTKIEELTARLPSKESAPFWKLVEDAASGHATLMPAIRRVRELEAEETRLLDLQEELRKISAVKWGPKKLPTGETATSLEKGLTTARKELDELMEKVKSMDERVSPLVERLKILDQVITDEAAVNAWAARGYTDPVPVCVVERMRWEEEEFLADATVLPMRRVR
jgi:hypothetical protein